jgi:hypothetical protein
MTEYLNKRKKEWPPGSFSPWVASSLSFLQTSSFQSPSPSLLQNCSRGAHETHPFRAWNTSSAILPSSFVPPCSANFADSFTCKENS